MKWVSIFGVLVILAFIVAQLNFIAFYDVFGLPFGKSDVDNYMGSVRGEINYYDHLGITLLPMALLPLIKAELFYTAIIPLMACVLLPITVFFFTYYMKRDKNIAAVSGIIFMFGTFSLGAYMISALWAQLFSTMFALWVIIFIDAYENIRNKFILYMAAISLVLVMLSHPVGLGLIIMFVLFKAAMEYDYGIHAVMTSFAVFAILSSYFVIIESMFGNYIYDVTVDYVINVFANPLVWLAGIVGMGLVYENKKDKPFVLTFIGLLLISPVFVLMRPLISGLVLLSYFAALGFDGMFARCWKRAKFIAIIMVIFIVVFTFNGFVDMIMSFMDSMLWEMEAEPGLVKNLPRDLDAGLFRRMYYGDGK